MGSTTVPPRENPLCYMVYKPVWCLARQPCDEIGSGSNTMSSTAKMKRATPQSEDKFPTFQEIIFEWLLKNSSQFSEIARPLTKSDLPAWMKEHLKKIWVQPDLVITNPTHFYARTHHESKQAVALRALLQNYVKSEKSFYLKALYTIKPDFMNPFTVLGLLVSGTRKSTGVILFRKQELDRCVCVSKSDLKGLTAELFFDVPLGTGNSVPCIQRDLPKSWTPLLVQGSDPSMTFGKISCLPKEPKKKGKAKGGSDKEHDSDFSPSDGEEEEEEEEEDEEESGSGDSEIGSDSGRARQERGPSGVKRVKGGVEVTRKGSRKRHKPVVRLVKPVAAAASEGQAAAGASKHTPVPSGANAPPQSSHAAGKARAVSTTVPEKIDAILAAGPEVLAGTMRLKNLMELTLECYELLRKSSKAYEDDFLEKSGLVHAPHEYRIPDQAVDPVSFMRNPRDVPADKHVPMVFEFLRWVKDEWELSRGRGVVCTGFPVPTTGSGQITTLPGPLQEIAQNRCGARGDLGLLYGVLTYINSSILIMFFLRRLEGITTKAGKDKKAALPTRILKALQRSIDLFRVFFMYGDAVLSSGCIYDVNTREFKPMEECSHFNSPAVVSDTLKGCYQDTLSWAIQSDWPLCCARRLAYEAFKEHADYPLFCAKYQQLPGVVAWFRRDMDQDPGPFMLARAGANDSHAPLAATPCDASTGRPQTVKEEPCVEEIAEFDPAPAPIPSTP